MSTHHFVVWLQDCRTGISLTAGQLKMRRSVTIGKSEVTSSDATSAGLYLESNPCAKAVLDDCLIISTTPAHFCVCGCAPALCNTLHGAAGCGYP